jgi:hypothetical protein
MENIKTLKDLKLELKAVIKEYSLELQKELKKPLKQAVKEASQPISRKVYNKTYYDKNRQKILANQCKKAKCELCGRSVVQYNLKKHYELPICKNIQARNKLLEDRKTGLEEENI